MIKEEQASTVLEKLLVNADLALRFSQRMKLLHLFRKEIGLSYIPNITLLDIEVTPPAESKEAHE